MDTLPVPSEHVVFTEFNDEEGVLVDLNTKRYYVLNETAMLVWQSLEKRNSLADLVREMTKAYDVSAEHASASVENLLEQLRSHHLVKLL